MILDSEDKEADYSDGDFKEVVANFVRVEMVYSKYSSSFPSKLQLHKHLKVGYTRVVQATPLFPTQTTLLVSITESKVIMSLLGLDLAFRV